MCRVVENVMTRDVVCVNEDTPYKELVKLLATRRVSAVPVIDDRRHVLGSCPRPTCCPSRRSRPGPHPAAVDATPATRTGQGEGDGRGRADEPAPDHDQHRGDIDRSGQAAAYQGLKRLPVIDAAGRLVGIVSRVDLLKMFLRSDEELHQEIVEGVIFGELFMGLNRFDVHVEDGVVVLQGRCERRGLIPTVVRAVAAVEGVVRVENRLGFDLDDLSQTMPEALARPVR
jgi:CBS domain-containing protein